jgi:uncharacterized protein HemX
MTTTTRDGHSQECLPDLHPTFAQGGLDLNHYLQQSNQELQAISELANRGETIGRDSREWMLAQVDFIVETIGDDDLVMDDEVRSNMLQLLLAIANLNEQIRHQTSLGL